MPLDNPPISDASRMPWGIGMICSAQVLAVLGEHIFLFNGLPLWAYDNLGGGRGVSLALAAVTLPALASYPAGLFASRFAPRQALIACAVVRTIFALLLLTAALFAVSSPGTGIWAAVLLLSLTAAVSLTDSFFMPVLKAALPLWSGEKEDARARANAALETADVPGYLLGPGVAVFLYQRFHGGLLFVGATLAGSYLLAFMLLLFVPAKRNTRSAPVLASTAAVSPAGRNLFSLLAVWAFSMVVLGTTQALALPFVRETLQRSEEIYGVLATLFGVGITIGAAATSLPFVLRREALRRVTLFLLLAGGGLFLTAAPTGIFGAGAGWILGGVGFAGITVTMTTFLQSEAAQKRRTGLIGLTHSLEAAGVAAGSLGSAALSHLLGIRGALALGGVILVAGAILTDRARRHAGTASRST